MGLGLRNEPRNAKVVTPHDTNPILGNALPVRRLYVGGTGTMTVRLFGDSADVLLSAIPVGKEFEGLFTHVRATGTSATLIVAFY